MAPCVLCCQEIVVYAIGECNHQVLCMECSVRLRVLYGNSTCPVCKTETIQIRYVTKPTASSPYRDRHDAFETMALQEQVHMWKSICCPCCFKQFSSMRALQQHVIQKHDGQLCRICCLYQKVFSHEQIVYSTKGKLKQHLMIHPKCKFCKNVSVFDEETLEQHMHDEHFACFLCERMQLKKEAYYGNYSSLARHFQEKHYACLDAQCLEKKYVVFATEIELQAHHAKEHVSVEGKSKSQIRNERTLHINFTIKREHKQQSSLWQSQRSMEPLKEHNVNDAMVAPLQTIAIDLEKLTLDELRQKNQQLIVDLKQALGNDDELFHQFKIISSKFQTGDLSSENYFEEFERLFRGSEASGLFLNLLSLLPDADKRQQLYLVYRRRIGQRRKSTNGKPSRNPRMQQQKQPEKHVQSSEQEETFTRIQQQKQSAIPVYLSEQEETTILQLLKEATEEITASCETPVELIKRIHNLPINDRQRTDFAVLLPLGVSPPTLELLTNFKTETASLDQVPLHELLVLRTYCQYVLSPKPLPCPPGLSTPPPGLETPVMLETKPEIKESKAQRKRKNKKKTVLLSFG